MLDYLKRLTELASGSVDLSAGTTPGWMKLPGGQIEYGTSGFVIALLTDPTFPPYLLTDPEGRKLFRGYVLQPLKELAMAHAADRAEFQP